MLKNKQIQNNTQVKGDARLFTDKTCLFWQIALWKYITINIFQKIINKRNNSNKTALYCSFKLGNYFRDSVVYELKWQTSIKADRKHMLQKAITIFL